MKARLTSKDRYLKDPLPIRLGNLASNLSRIGARCQNIDSRGSVEIMVKESQLFIEWTMADFAGDIHQELESLKSQLSSWQDQIEQIWDKENERMKISKEARDWSSLLLNRSGLLNI